MAQKAIPRLLFVGAGNIAQSIIKGIIKARPNASNHILATAPSTKNLSLLDKIGCKTIILNEAHKSIVDFKPDFVFLCFKPQVFLKSIDNFRFKKTQDHLYNFLNVIPRNCTTLSLLAGVERHNFVTTFSMEGDNFVRVMLNTAAEIGSTSVLYHATTNFTQTTKAQEMEDLFNLIGKAVVKLNDESLMDVATGLCGSGIAFFYEMIQTVSDIGVKNGLNRTDATLVAAQLSKSAGEMLLEKKSHPYKLRDDVTSPAGTTIYGLSSWHQNSTNQCISNSFQASIDRAKSLTKDTKDKIDTMHQKSTFP